MKQTLHIFAKDSRKFWPEILISLVLELTYAKLYPQVWLPELEHSRIPTWLPYLVAGLVVVSWWLLIARVVHAESLVGEKQFWITRPYRWWSLLAAKVLFVGAYVIVPYALALCLVLREARFHPTAYLSGLCFLLVLTVCIVVMPLLVLAAITSSFVRMGLAVLIVVAFAVGVGYSTELLPSSGTPGDFGMRASTALIECAFAGIVALQYARRRTGLARILLAAVAVTIGLFGLFGPEKWPMSVMYPAHPKGNTLPIQLSFDSQREPRADLFLTERNQREMGVSFPLRLDGMPGNTVVKADAAQVEISAKDGEHWSSHWQTVYETWLPSEHDASITLKVNTAFYERIKDVPVTVRLQVGLTELHAGEVQRFRLPHGSFTIPGGAICYRSGFGNADISCRSALKDPPLMMVATKFATKPCSDERILLSDGANGMTWTGGLDNDPADFGITSVVTTKVSFEQYSSDGSNTGRFLCPGSPVAFVAYTPLVKTQQTLTSSLITLGSHKAASEM